MRWIRGEGRAVPLRRATLRTGVGGRVVGVPVREGAEVSTGDLLVQFDSTLASLRRRAAEAEHERAVLEFRSLTFEDTLLGLDPRGLRLRRRHARAHSGLDRTGAELEVARLALARTAVRAPFTGRVAGLAVGPGTDVRPGDSLLTVVDATRTLIEAAVLEEDAGAVRPGARARVTFAANPARFLAGEVTALSPVVERPAGRVRVHVLLEASPVDGSTEAIRPGTFAEVRIAARELPAATLVPIAAIARRDARDVVFRFRPDRPGARTGTAEWVEVEVLEEGGGRAAVRARRSDRALSAGSLVLVEGHVLLAHGAPVLLRETGTR